MPSKFPGMDPYLERDSLWPDVHNAFCMRLRAALNRELPDGYVARVEERLIVESKDSSQQRIGDVTVSDSGRTIPGAIEESSDGTVAVVVPVLSDPVREVYLEILDRVSGDLVTLIELLSPTNRRSSSHRNEFLQKRDEILQSQVNYVEIDLLREQPRLPIEGLPSCDYYVLIRQSNASRNARLHAVSLEDCLPKVRIPLRDGETVQVDLQAVFREMFDEGRYVPRIYDTPPTPPLTAEQLAWAESLSAS